jgi:hypothetical protein
MPELAPTAVTLKINRTSVMLYACHYVRLPEGVGATVQTYLGSFPLTATEVPPKFAALLREVTLGRPGRYQVLMQRINDAVLEPARARRERAEVERQRVAVGQALEWATESLQALPAMVSYDVLVRTPELRVTLAKLLEAAGWLTEDAGGPPVGQEAPAAAAPPPVTGDSPAATAEEALQSLLAQLETAYDAILELMPEARSAFQRGHTFEEETVRRVQRLWFKAADAIASLGCRKQLKRPANWSRLREAVLGNRSEAQPLPEVSPLW